MAFECTVRTGRVAEITLSGDLDAATAEKFHAALEALARPIEGAPTHLVLHMRNLVFLASAGVRVLLTVKQTHFRGLIVYVIAPQEQPLEAMRKAQVHRDFVILDYYPPPTG
jgi:anti-anti-sigma factor